MNQTISPPTLITFKESCEKHTINPSCGHVGPGWSILLDKLIIDLKQIGWDDDLQQVKEKFGVLRFYIGKGSEEIHIRIDKSEEESSVTCEDCGSAGHLTNLSGWLKTLCDSCQLESIARKNSKPAP